MLKLSEQTEKVLQDKMVKLKGQHFKEPTTPTLPTCDAAQAANCKWEIQ